MGPISFDSQWPVFNVVVALIFEGDAAQGGSLLLAFVCLASAALFINAGASLATFWEHADTIANLAAICAAAAVS